MKGSILFFGILLISLSAKSQNWDPEFVKSLKEYYFIPVEFENFGEWIAGIENDSSLVFKKKIFTQVNDSINLNFELQKPGFSSPFKNSTISIQIIGKTRLDKKLKMKKGGFNSFGFNQLPPRKVTSLYIYSSISFDSTSEGKLLAAQAIKQLEDQLGNFFSKKDVIKANKNKHKRKHHPEVEKAVRFTTKNDLFSRFWITNSTFPDKNEVELYLAYELNH